LDEVRKHLREDTTVPAAHLKHHLNLGERLLFYKAEERFLSGTFQVWSVHFSRTRRGNSVRERHTLRFHKIFIRNYLAQYLKGLDPGFYWALPSPLSKRLYRLVDLERHGSLAWKTDLFDLRQQIPLTGYSYVSELKRALEPAHRELIGRGFLGGVEYRGKSGVLYRVSQDSVLTSFCWSCFSVFGCVVAMLGVVGMYY
jgi:hypothetical protein